MTYIYMKIENYEQLVHLELIRKIERKECLKLNDGTYLFKVFGDNVSLASLGYKD